jgi:hypothetical protein
VTDFSHHHDTHAWPQDEGHPAGEAHELDLLEITLSVTDPETVAELLAHPDGRQRHEFALTALRIGVLALKQAQGRIDADTVRHEGERLLGELDHHLERHREGVTQQVATNLKDYFDPDSGRFNERLERLLRKDGELEQVLQRQIALEDSELAKTLAAHFGERSPLMKLLSPDESQGLLQHLRGSLDEALRTQRESILREFSLDNKDSALTRLISELTQRHSKLTEDLQGSIKEVTGEFSLDNEDSALSRLVRRVEQAQKQISSEFSLDTDSSALARMRKELLEVLSTYRNESVKFQQEVREALADMKARKEAALRSTTHGDVFEQALLGFVEEESRRAGDLLAHVGNTTGLIKNCKVGDLLIELGPDRSAAGARIVVEAKESAGYDIAKAREEIELGRKNRGAEVGLFVFSRLTAPTGLDGLLRYGNDVIAVWDAEDPSYDVFLRGAISVAHALCTRAAAQRAVQQADFESIERAIRDIEKQSSGLEEISTFTNTIRTSSDKVLNRARIMREVLSRQIATLDEKIVDLKSVVEGRSSSD